MLPEIISVGGNDDTKFEDLKIGDKSISGGKCIAKLLVIVTDEDFNHFQLSAIGSSTPENNNIEFYEKMWDEAKKKYINTMKRYNKSAKDNIT